MPALVQSSGKAQATSVLSISKSFASLPATGNFIVVVVHRYGSVSAGTLTDNQGNTYTLAVEDASGSTPGCAIYYCANIPAPSGTFTLTYTMPSSGNAWLVAEEWSGMGAATVLATANSGVGGPTITVGPTASITPGINGSLVVAAVSSVGGGAPVVESVTPAWSEIGAEAASPFYPQGRCNARAVTAAGTQSCTWTQSGTSANGSCLAVFDAAGAVSGLTYSWTKESGPGTVTFSPSANVEDPQACVSQPGTYVFRLTVNNGEIEAYDEVTHIFEVSGGTSMVLVINAEITEFLVETLNVQAAANALDTLQVGLHDDTIATVVPLNAEILLFLEGERIFGGVLNMPRYRGFGNIGWAQIHTEIQATDFNLYARRRVVTQIMPPGSVTAPVNISNSVISNPGEVTTLVPHGFTTGDTVLIAGHGTDSFPGQRAYGYYGEEFGSNTNFSDGDTVTIGSRTYTMESSFSDTANYVLIGSTALASKQRLRNAINGGSGEGTTYGTGTAVHTDVTAYIPSNLGGGPNDEDRGYIIVLKHNTIGAAGNGLGVSTSTSSGMRWFTEGNTSITELGGGIDAETGSTSPLNGTHTVTVLDASRFTVPVNNTVTAVGGTATRVFYMRDVLEAIRVEYLADRNIVLHPDQVLGPAVPAITPEYQTVDAALDVLGVSAGGYIWEVDYFKQLRMWLPGEIDAPFDIEDDDGHVIGDMSVEYEEEFANAIFLLAGGTGIGDIVQDAVVADGIVHGGIYGYTFNYPAHDNIQDAWPNLIYFNGVQTAIADWWPNPVLPGAVWWWDPYTHTLFHDEDNDSDNPTPPAGTIISVSYRSKYPIVIERVNQDSIDTIGQVDKVVREDDIKSLSQAILAAEEELTVAVDQPRTIRYTTETPGLHPGQTQHVTSPIRDIDADFLIVEVNTVNDESDAVRYRITAIEGSHLRGTWRDIFKNWNG
jgi:hypothetical protein